MTGLATPFLKQPVKSVSFLCSVACADCEWHWIKKTWVAGRPISSMLGYRHVSQMAVPYIDVLGHSFIELWPISVILLIGIHQIFSICLWVSKVCCTISLYSRTMSLLIPFFLDIWESLGNSNRVFNRLVVILSSMLTITVGHSVRFAGLVLFGSVLDFLWGSLLQLETPYSRGLLQLSGQPVNESVGPVPI